MKYNKIAQLAENCSSKVVCNAKYDTEIKLKNLPIINWHKSQSHKEN